MNRSVGALLSCASSTSFTTRAIVLSEAAAVTRTRSTASPLMVPAKTLSSALLRSGVLSPVTGASSMALSPAMITPSAGDPVAGTHEDHRADRDGFGRHFLGAALLRAARFSAPVPSGFDAGASPAGGDTFQQFTDQKQEHDRGRFLASADDQRRRQRRSSSAFRSRTACRPAPP